MSLQRILERTTLVERVWVGPDEAVKISKEDAEEYSLAHDIMKHLCVQAPIKHKSGHPGGPLSAFTFAYEVMRRRDPKKDAALHYSAGHLSLLAYGLQWMFRRDNGDARLASPESIIENFRTPSGLPGHVEAGIGDIPFGTGPLGKGTSVALGRALGMRFLKQKGVVDVVLADGDSQEGQVMEAFRLASHLKLDNLIVHGDWNDVQLSDEPSKTVAADFAKIAESAGWRVIEVQNGNDQAQVRAALELADSFVGKGAPIFLCYYTTMGSGIAELEKGVNDGTANYHGSPLKEDMAAAVLKNIPSLPELTKSYEAFRKKFTAFNTPEPLALSALAKATRTIATEKGSARSEFGSVHLKALMEKDPRIVVLHADLAGSGGFDKVAKVFPDRVMNVGVAEANMVMMAAGLRQAGMLPVTYTFAAFATNEARASARLIDVNCGHTRCSVFNDATHAGLSVGEDGETHQERHYLNIPFDHTQVWMPADSNQAAAAAEKGLGLVAEGKTSVYCFFARSGHEQLKTPSGEILYGKDYTFDGTMDLVRGKGTTEDTVTVIASGIPVHDAILAAQEVLPEGISVRVLNAACIRPLDASAVIEAALETMHIIVVEDHSSEGGLATQVADVIADFQLPCTLRRLGVNHYFPSGTDKDLKFLAGLDSESISEAIRDEKSHEVCGGEDAFVTALFTLSHNVSHSRFKESVARFVNRLKTDTSYLETLREVWKKRTVSTDKLPSNKQLLEKLIEETLS